MTMIIDDEDARAFAGPTGASFPASRHPRPGRSSRVPALVFSFAWFYWRGLPVWGALIPLPALVGLYSDLPAPGFLASLALHLGISFRAPALLRSEATRRVRRADAAGLDRSERSAYLARAGRACPLGAVLAGVLWLAMAAVLVRAFVPGLR